MEIKKLPYNNETNEHLCYFEAIISGDMAGYILVEDNFPIKEYCCADYIFVEDKYTRKGVATSLYNVIERFLGKIMIPSGTLIGKNIREFWRSRGTLFPELLENRTFSTKEMIDIITNTPQ
jgi:GNAT superfamily N-acetyltransferase